jgi:CRISPR-associated Csx2 family protein
MTHYLVGFLGRASLDPHTGYRRASYQFQDGRRVDDVTYFGIALKRYVKPDAMVVLGTSGSMWDVFIEAFAEDDSLEAERLALIDKAASAAVSPADLKPLRALVEAGLGLPVKLGVIPYGRDTEEQVAILRQLLDAVDGADRVTLDLTHGFRHLPMLGLLCALFLEQVRGIQVEAIYYGALEMTEEGVTPVLRLDGLLHMVRWLQALHTYDKDGDYGVFCPLFEAEGMTRAGLLDEAAFYERTTNPVKARERLAGFNSGLDAYEGLVGGLFVPALEARIRWFRGPDRAAWEQALAQEYLERGDFLRAAIYAQEAYISGKLPRGRDDDFDRREEVRQHEAGDGPFRQLVRLRNTMAHGVKPRDNRVLKALANEDALRGTLRDLFEQLFGK